MSYDVIKLDYELAAEMSKTFQAGAEQLQDTMQEMMNLANVLQEGALLGRAGVTFVEAIQSKLCPSIAKLTEKYKELDADVQQAVKFMQEADKKSASSMGG